MFRAVFRGKLASASLKPLSTPVCDQYYRRIPRQACLGLIEAGSAQCQTRIRDLVFRGKLASASLKPLAFFNQTRAILRYSEASLPRPH